MELAIEYKKTFAQRRLRADRADAPAIKVTPVPARELSEACLVTSVPSPSREEATRHYRRSNNASIDVARVNVHQPGTKRVYLTKVTGSGPNGTVEALGRSSQLRSSANKTKARARSYR